MIPLLRDSGGIWMRRNLFWLSNEQWHQIEPHLPTDDHYASPQHPRQFSQIKLTPRKGNTDSAAVT
jgi:hypothetical protein